MKYSGVRCCLDIACVYNHNAAGPLCPSNDDSNLDDETEKRITRTESEHVCVRACEYVCPWVCVHANMYACVCVRTRARGCMRVIVNA